MKYLIIILLFSCQDYNWKQEVDLRNYFDIVLDKLENNTFQRDQIVLKSEIINAVARTYENGIIFDSRHLDFAPDSYIELVMLHEVLHAVYGWQPEKKDHDIMWIPFKEHTSQEIELFYQKAKGLI